MNLRSVLPVALLASFALPAFAQSNDEESMDYTLPTDEWYVPKNTLHFGVRALNKGISVKFGNLGSVASMRNVVPASAGAADREYDTGYVYKDAARQVESLPTTVDPEPGNSAAYAVYENGRYKTYLRSKDADGNVFDAQTGDFLSYDAAYSRIWGVQSESQIANGYAAFSNYSALSEGATAEKEEGFTGGVELALSRQFGNLGRRMQWGVTAGLAMNTMSARTSGMVRSTLVTYTDYFQFNGPVPAGTTSGPTYGDLRDDIDGNDFGLETTVPIGAAPDPSLSTTTTVVGGANVQGNWQVKGAYFMLRVGPTLRTQITERFGLSASAGVAGAYSGSRYTVMEQIELPDVVEPVVEERHQTEGKFLSGFYADVNVDWVATDRTGLFAGVMMQQFGTYEMAVAGRTAKIDLGNSIGLRGGISIKF